MAAGEGKWEAYEKTSVDLSYPSLVRFAGHVELKGVRPRTVEAYTMMLRLLARWAGSDPAELSEEQVREFFLHLLRDRQYAPQSIRQARAALTAFYTDMLERTEWKVMASVKTKDLFKLPLVLSREEVAQILGCVREQRFAVPLRLIYLCGLRLSECLHLEVKDVQRAGLRLHIREGKGGKDRMVPLPEAALRDLEQWWRWHRHPRLLFPAMGRSWKATLQRGQAERDRLQRQQLHAAEHPMSDSALQNAWRMALATSGLDRRAHIHTLRHSYATHLLEEGVSLRYVSAYLGHARLEQTLVYAHLTAVSEAQTQEAVARMAASLTRPPLPAILPPAR
jgi:integrase/recombinase XerD